MATTIEKRVADILDSFASITSKPETFLSVSTDLASKLKNITKSVYDETKNTEGQRDTEALPELLLSGFDDEQIWQEIELQNSDAIDTLLKDVSQLSTENKLSFKSGLQSKFTANAKSGDSEEEIEDEEDDEDQDMDDLDQEDEEIEEDEEDDDIPGVAGFNFGGDDSGEESEEEKELKRLLDKTEAMDKENDKGDADEDSDEDDGNLFGDVIEEQNLFDDNKKKGKQQKPSERDSSGPKKRKTAVDDKFFKLADLETFLNQEDAKEERKRRKEEKGEENDDSDDSDEEDEDVDVFADIPSEDEGVSGRDIRYKDFFDPPDNVGKVSDKKLVVEEEKDASEEEEAEEGEASSENSEEEVLPTKKKNLLGDDSDEDDGKGKKKSSYEERQERLAKKIKDLEAANLQQKPWQLLGEAGASARPENSLLQEDLDFEQQTRLAPEITEETTKTLEEIIIQRIKDQAWDDVERKVKPVDTPFEFKKKVVLDQEKSKKSLGEIYEEEYLKQAEQEKEEKEDPEHESIRKSMTALFIQLDALANFHYTPKPAAPEVKVLTSLPSVSVEEVAPVSVSEAAMLAPEEVMEKDRKDLKGDTEKTKEDKKADRRAKKTRKRERRKEKERRQKIIEKLNPGLGNKYAKEKAMADLEKQSKAPSSAVTLLKEGSSRQKSDLTSSSKFFDKLQDRVTSRIADAKGGKKKEKKKKSHGSSAKLKL